MVWNSTEFWPLGPQFQVLKVSTKPTKFKLARRENYFQTGFRGIHVPWAEMCVCVWHRRHIPCEKQLQEEKGKTRNSKHLVHFVSAVYCHYREDLVCVVLGGNNAS